MSTIKGIFEPFASYVTDQLNIRKAIISNQSLPGSLNSDDTTIESLQQAHDLTTGMTQGTWDDMFEEDTSVMLNEIPIIEQRNQANLLSRNEHFYTYVSEKQCIIRMASGVDIKE